MIYIYCVYERFKAAMLRSVVLSSIYIHVEIDRAVSSYYMQCTSLLKVCHVSLRRCAVRPAAAGLTPLRRCYLAAPLHSMGGCSKGDSIDDQLIN